VQRLKRCQRLSATAAVRADRHAFNGVGRRPSVSDGGNPMDDRIATENDDIQCIQVDIPQSLMSRVENYCRKRNITTREFICDALSEKLQMAHKERRRKQRV
jgi:hypothetical protein